MDKMSLFSILTVSVPEAILNVYLAFLITGEKTNLYLADRINIMRMLYFVCALVISQAVTRAVLPNIILVLLINLFVATMLLKIIYKMHWHKAVANSVIMYGFLVSLEIFYTPLFIGITGLSANEIYSNDYIRLLYAVPERVIHLFIIISLWNWNRAFLNLKEYKEIRSSLGVFAIVVLGIEASFFFVFINNVDKFAVNFKIAFSIGLFLFSVFNFFLLRLISVLTNAVMKKEMMEFFSYKKNALNGYRNIYLLLEKGKLDEAKEICQFNFSSAGGDISENKNV